MYEALVSKVAILCTFSWEQMAQLSPVSNLIYVYSGVSPIIVIRAYFQVCLGVQPVSNVSWQDSKAHSKHSEDVHIDGDWILTSSPHFDVLISETAMLCTLF